MRLKAKCEERSCEFYEVDEYYTSKMCGNCRNIHYNLGEEKRYVCPIEECGYIADRDANAARNILIKGIA